MKVVARYLVSALLAASVSVPAPAFAALDPTTAGADVRAVMEADDYAFCSKPADPLSPRARSLCPLAGEIPGCTALALACDKVDEPETVDPFWKRLGALLGHVIPYVAWALVMTLVLLAVYLAVRAVRTARRDDRLPDDALPGASVTVLGAAAVSPETAPADALLQRAAEARARGDARGALFLYLAASLRALADRDAIRLARDRTNGEYLRACHETSARPALRALVREVDAVQFGGAPATDDAAGIAEVEAIRIVRAGRPAGASALPALMLLFVFVVLAGCKLDGGSKDDPAGRDLLVDLLEKQGAKVEAVGGSLAHLPMKGKEGPAIILDAERVRLEDATAKHLVEWVDQGGTLILAGSPALWPDDFWAKPLGACEPGIARVEVTTRHAPRAPVPGPDDDDDVPPSRALPDIHHATLATCAAMTWPSEDQAPRAIARLPDHELYGALRSYGAGQILGLANAELFTNLGIATPGNAEAVVAMLQATGKDRFAVARREQGVAPPDNPFAGLLHIGLGPALVHVAVFLPLLFLAYGVRQVAPRREPPSRRRAFAEHVRAVGGLYARRRAKGYALAAYARHVDDRVRTVVARGSDPAEALAAAANVDVPSTRALYDRAMTAASRPAPIGDPLRDLARLGALYIKATTRR